MWEREKTGTKSRAAREGRLLSRPSPVSETAASGLRKLETARGPGGLFYVPPRYDAARPAALMLMLHGAGGEPEHSISLLQDFAEEFNLIVLAPKSQRATWDAIGGNYGPDVASIDEALAQLFQSYAIDTERIAAAGFSDGASYALSLGVTNGELFTHIIAFSPGFMVPAGQVGSPRIFISHGTRDRILPIERCSRVILKQVERAGYDVTYREFDGPHMIPPEVVREAVAWLTAS